jgi:hypothetical protein
MFTLDQVVPWGRSFDEYRRMFRLSNEDLRSRILGCGDGPASFNAEATHRGFTVVSCDPLYRFDTGAIRSRINATYPQVMDQARQNVDDFIWNVIPSIEELGVVRMRAMDAFLDDFDAGKAQGRYVEAGLPTLPFDTATFDLAVCSHFLFLYSAQLTREFHLAALDELCRVAREVRVFPLLALGPTPSPHVEPARTHLAVRGFNVSIEKVDYEFQRGCNQVMRITADPRSSVSAQGRTSPAAPRDRRVSCQSNL